MGFSVMKLKASTVFLTSVLAAFSTGSFAKSIDNRDAFEKEYIKCFKEGLEQGCFEKEFSGFFDSRVKNKDIVPTINNFLISWMKDSKIYDVYKIDAHVKGQIYDTRTYLIEQSDGNLMGVAIGFIRVAGEWKIFQLDVSNRDKFMQHILDLKNYSND